MEDLIKEYMEFTKLRRRDTTFDNKEHIIETKIKPYLSYMKKDGEFYKVIINVPENKNNRVWGVVGSGQQIEGIDKDTLDDLPL